MNVSSVFASISDKLGKDGTLDTAAQLAPGGAAYEILSVSSDAAQENVTQITSVADSTQLVADSTELISSQNAEFYPRMSTARESIDAGIRAIYISASAVTDAATAAAASASAAVTAVGRIASNSNLAAAQPAYTYDIGGGS